MTAEKVHDDESRAMERMERTERGQGREPLVPASYAEKAMSSLLRLHQDLVEEKERRIDLYRRLMEREQTLAELRAYVKLLEAELARRGFDPAAHAIDPLAPAGSVERFGAGPAAGGGPAARQAPPSGGPSAPRPGTAEPEPRAPSPRPNPPSAADRPVEPPRPAAPEGMGPAGPVLAWTPGQSGSDR